MITKQLILAEKFDHRLDGKRISLFTITNDKDFTVQITNYGAALVAIYCPDKNGGFEDIILGYDNIKAYLQDDLYHGIIAGRYANRIAKGRFSIEGIDYKLARNNDGNALHGGVNGFGKVIWDAFLHDQSLTLYYKSKDREEGYPGNLEVRVKYTVTDNNELIVDYKATTDKKTVVNLTNHAYFNLKGSGTGNIQDHHLKLFAEKFTPKDKSGIPTGEIWDVADTPLDFRDFKPIGQDIDQASPQLDPGLGFDHNFVVDRYDGKLREVAAAFDPESNRYLELYSTMPGLQFYTGDYLGNGSLGKHDVAYQPRDGFCLETQFFPDSPNQTSFPSTILSPGNTFSHQSVYKFGIKPSML